MSQVALTFPDSTYSSSNKPSVATLKADLTAIETAHNDTDTNSVTLTGTQVLTNKTLTSPTINTPTITTPTIKTYDGWQSVTDSWAYASADAPTFTITVPSGAASLYGVGWRIKLNQTTDKYFIITAVADTVLTVYGGTDYTLANAAISSVYVSPMKAPLGFPLDPTKWTQTASDTTERVQATPTSGTWYNLGSFSLTIPIGAWDVQYQINGGANDNSATGYMWATLSTANNSESDADFSALIYSSHTTSTTDVALSELSRRKVVVLAAKTTYYLNCRVDTANIDQIRINTSIISRTSKGIIRAICAYL